MSNKNSFSDELPDNLTLEQLPKAFVKLYDKVINIEKLSQQRNNEPSLAKEELLTVGQTAEFLSLTVPTVYLLVRKKEISVCKRGKRLYFLRDDLIGWVKLGRLKTNAEISEENSSFLLSKKRGGRV